MFLWQRSHWIKVHLDSLEAGLDEWRLINTTSAKKMTFVKFRSFQTSATRILSGRSPDMFSRFSRKNYHSFSHPLFHWGGLQTEQPQEVSKYLCGQQQSQEVLFSPDQDGNKQGWRCNHATWFLFDLLAVSCGCGQQDLPRQSFMEHSGRIAEPT